MILNEETGHVIAIGKATYNRLGGWAALRLAQARLAAWRGWRWDVVHGHLQPL